MDNVSPEEVDPRDVRKRRAKRSPIAALALRDADLLVCLSPWSVLSSEGNVTNSARTLAGKLPM